MTSPARLAVDNVRQIRRPISVSGQWVTVSLHINVCSPKCRHNKCFREEDAAALLSEHSIGFVGGSVAMMPFKVLGIWFRGLMAAALLGIGIYLLTRWFNRRESFVS